MRLLYLGKKSPLKLDMDVLRGNYVFGTEPIDVNDIDARWLLKTNPKMFKEVAEDFQPPEPEPAPAEPAPPKYVCPKCGFSTDLERFWNEHECPDWEEVDGTFVCKLCDHEPYTEHRWFSQHMKAKHDIDIPPEKPEKETVE